MISAIAAAQASQNSSLESPLNQLKLRRAAAEFEGMLLSKWWSTMRESGFGDSDQTDPGHDTLDQLGMQSLSSAVAADGGIGLGDMLVRGLLSNFAGGAKAPPSGK